MLRTLFLFVASGDSSAPRKPTVLTSADVADYTMEDLVMPLPGYDVVYPTNEVGSWYQELLQQDGFADSSALQHKIRYVWRCMLGSEILEICQCLFRGFAKEFFSTKIRVYYGSGSRSHSEFFCFENHPKIALNQ